MYFLSSDMKKIHQSLGAHVNYWRKGNFAYFKNGPFADKSGGLIIFSATDEKQAEKTIAGDPLLQGKAIQQFWLKEWII